MSEPEPRADLTETETLLRRVIAIITNTRTLPLSSSVKLDNRDEVLELLEEACQRFPDELRQARWLVKERDEYLEKMGREGDEILEAARARAERMVQRTEIVREAQHTARRTVEEAREAARRLRHESEDYCDQKLASFEVVLERLVKTVHAGREKLSVTAWAPEDREGGAGRGGPGDDGELAADDAFFDQDRE